jgi:hypothetical protein
VGDGGFVEWADGIVVVIYAAVVVVVVVVVALDAFCPLVLGVVGVALDAVVVASWVLVVEIVVVVGVVVVAVGHRIDHLNNFFLFNYY